MISTLEIIDKLYLQLNVADVKTAISGGVYKEKRPINSTKEDVVIGCLPTNNLQLQTTVANVNIHVPNLVLNTNGIQDNTQPDFARLRTLTTLLIAKLKDQWAADYWFDVQQQNTFSEEELNEHYSNIRVNFYSLNI